MTGPRELEALLSDGSWHASDELRRLLGDGWQDVLATLRATGATVQARREAPAGGRVDRYSYRLCRSRTAGRS